MMVLSFCLLTVLWYPWSPPELRTVRPPHLEAFDSSLLKVILRLFVTFEVFRCHFDVIQDHFWGCWRPLAFSFFASETDSVFACIDAALLFKCRSLSVGFLFGGNDRCLLASRLNLDRTFKQHVYVGVAFFGKGRITFASLINHWFMSFWC